MSAPMPTYIICRDTQPGQAFDPTAPLVFYPPKDSDELFDALRMKYPQFRSHCERMREAVIEFLLEEQQVPQFPTPVIADSTLTSPWEASMQSMSSGSSTWSSPELFDLATPSFGNSPQPQASQLSRQQSTAATVSSNPTPPALEQMTGVFSLSDAAQPKQRVRRKMTEAEKIVYRQRRIVKACEKCSKRKRKCNHNLPDMESVGASKAQKVAKPSQTTTTKKALPLTTPEIQEENVFGAGAVDFSDSFGSEMSMPELSNYSTLFDDTLPDLSLDDYLVSADQQWPWSNTADWTLMDSSTEDLYPMNNARQEPQLNTNVPSQEYSSGGGGFEQNFGGSGEMFGHDMMQITGGGADKRMLWEHLRTGQEDILTETQQPTHTPHVREMDEKGAFEYDGDFTAPSFDWNLQSNQSYPRHKIWEGAFNFDADHTETAGWAQAGLQANQNLLVFDNVQDRRGSQHSSLSQMTLRLTGTVKAVKAFGNLLPSSSSRKKRIQSVSLKKVALLALGGFSTVQGLQRDPADDPRPFVCRNASCAAGRQFVSPKVLNRHMKTHHGMVNKRHASLDTIADSMTIEDYLRMHTNASPVKEDGRAKQSTPTPWKRSRAQDVTSIASVRANAHADVERHVKSKIQSHNPDSESSGARAPTSLHSAAHQGRRVPSLGEGITTSTSPSTELYLLKRRIPKALHSVVDRNSPAAALGPLLMTVPESVDTYTASDYEREIIISRNVEFQSGNSILTDGGAYLTLDPTNSTTPLFTGGSGAASSSAQPVHTRPSKPSASGFAFDAKHYAGARLDGRAATAIKAARVPSAGAISPTARHVQLEHVQDERLSDHVRRRDHFGRPSRSHLVAGLMFSLAAFATLVLLSFAQTTPGALSLLLLALAAPVQTSKGSHKSGQVQSLSQAWLRPVRDIIENSSWHTGLQRVQNHLPARIFASRLMHRGCDSDWRRGQRESFAGGVVVV